MGKNAFGKRTWVPASRRLTRKRGWGMSMLGEQNSSDSSVRYVVGDSDSRPWGKWEVLAIGDRYTLKRIKVLPGHRLSLQYHRHRSEHWTIVQGFAEVELDDAVHQMSSGKHIHIPVGALHRVRALGSEPLVFLEIQVGRFWTRTTLSVYSMITGASNRRQRTP